MIFSGHCPLVWEGDFFLYGFVVVFLVLIILCCDIYEGKWMG